MLLNHEEIIRAIHERREVIVTWPSKEDGGKLQSRRCAPMDYGPSRRGVDPSPRYHFWDGDSDSGTPHPLTLLASQITRVEIVDTQFDPATFVTWDLAKSPWHVHRTTWGAYN